MPTSEEDADIGLRPAPGYPWPVGQCMVGVFPGSRAAEAGVRPGEVITKVFAGGNYDIEKSFRQRLTALFGIWFGPQWRAQPRLLGRSVVGLSLTSLGKTTAQK